MTFPSALRYRSFVLRHTHGQLRQGDLLSLSLHHPVRARFDLRELGSDPSLFQELFVSEVYRDVADHVKNCRTIVDLGANIGLAALYLADRYPAAHIVAVEPLPENYSLLQRNLRDLMRNRRASTVQAAIWSSDGEVSLGMPVAGEFCQAAVNGIVGETKVPAITMAKLMAQQGLSQIDLLKVDIEGAEVELFRGPTDWIQNVQAIAIEFHGDSRERSGFDELMRSHGLTVRVFNAHTVLVTR